MKRVQARRCSRLLTALMLLAAGAAVVYGALHFLPQPAYAPNAAGKTLVINEVVADNLLGLRDTQGNTPDWIELYNYGNSSVVLDGCGLSDDMDDPFRYTFPAGTSIDGGAYLIVFASADGVQTEQTLNAPFGLRAEETLLLTDAEGRLIDKVRLPKKTEPGTAVGRSKKDCATFAVLMTPTPGAFNHSAIYAPLTQLSADVAPPKFSASGGFFAAPFSLELASDDPEAVIYYTLDGSEPDQNSMVYTSPLQITDRSDEKNLYAGLETSALYYSSFIKVNDDPVYKGTVVRAKCCKDNTLSEETATNTYFIAPQYSLPVVSVVTDPASLFDEDRGIYVPGTKMKLWKKYNPETPTARAPTHMHYNDETVQAHAEFFETDGTCLFSDNVGLYISGNSASFQSCKNLGLVSAKKYGSHSAAFHADLFGGSCTNLQDERITLFHTIRLRTSGGGSEYDGTMLKDAYLQQLVAPVYPFTLAYRPCIVFIDGEYWGIHNLREKFEDQYFRQHFGVSADSVTFFKHVDDPEAAEFNQFVDKTASMDLSVKKNYDYIAQHVDIENMVSYFAIECYLNNRDFFGKNVGLWRADDPGQPYGDNRWRFILFDLDAAFLDEQGELLEEIINEMDNSTKYSYIRLFRKLLENDEFRQSLIRTIDEYGQTVFAPQTAFGQLDDMLGVIAPEMREHCSRWQMVRGPVGKLLSFISGEQIRDLFTNWESSQDTLRGQLTARPQQMRELLVKVFGEDATAYLQTEQ